MCASIFVHKNVTVRLTLSFLLLVLDGFRVEN